jgi:hypothetical protein
MAPNQKADSSRSAQNGVQALRDSSMVALSVAGLQRPEVLQVRGGN